MMGLIGKNLGEVLHLKWKTKLFEVHIDLGSLTVSKFT